MHANTIAMADRVYHSDRLTGREIRPEGSQPWQGLGKSVKGAMDRHEALKRSGQDFTVEAAPLTATLSDGTQVSVSRRPSRTKAPLNGYRRVIIRTDNQAPLGYVSDRYVIVQNVEAYDFLDELVGNKELTYETAGSLYYGSKVWVLAKAPGQIRIGQTDDIVEKFLLFSNSHDGSSAVRCGFTPIRVVCSNTLAMAHEDLECGLSFKHTGNIQEKIEESRLALAKSTAFFDFFGSEANTTLEPIQSHRLEAYFKALYPDPAGEKSATKAENKRQKLTELFETGRGSDIPGVSGTVWQAYNAVTEWVDHFQGSSDQRRLDSAWFGPGHRTKAKAFDLAVKMAKEEWTPNVAVTTNGADFPNLTVSDE